MKKIISLLGAITLSTTLSTSVSACKHKNEEYEQYKIINNEIIYNFKLDNVYIIEYVDNGQLREQNFYTEHLPMAILLYTHIGQYHGLNIDKNKAWLDKDSWIKLIALKKII